MEKKIHPALLRLFVIFPNILTLYFIDWLSDFCEQ